MGKTKLKPCPFCGGRPEVQPYREWPADGIRYEVVCEDCFCGTARWLSKSIAIERWNNRTTKARKP